MPICPLPRTWAEAEAVDTVPERLKREEGKQWEDVVSMVAWTGMGQFEIAITLPVSYPILKKRFQDDGVR